MRRLVPRTLRGQLVLMILATFVLVQGVSLWLFVDERRLAVRAALGLEAAGRAANVVRLIEATPPALHDDILKAADSPQVRFAIAEAPSVSHVQHDMGGRVARRLQRLLGDEQREIRVELHQLEGAYPPPAGSMRAQMPADMRRLHDQMMGDALTPVEMRLAIALGDGRWLNVTTRFHRPPIQWPWVSIATFAVATVLISLGVWLVLSRLTGPLRRLAQAAEGLGRGEEVAALPTDGPEELTRLTRAFNDMQARLSRFISERTRLLAALGHDLRSPLTALRVRAEMVEDDETRTRLIAIVAEMQEMVESTLSFARGMVTSEAMSEVDLAAFLSDLAGELRATHPDGPAPSLDIPPGLRLRVKPVALRRALRNLVENALRYGGAAHVTARADGGGDGGQVRITITDNGPGIPEADLERVFDPFVRVEGSRSKETGGTGLGLSIARTVIHAHGGEITLTNRPEGGLRVEVVLPRAP